MFRLALQLEKVCASLFGRPIPSRIQFSVTVIDFFFTREETKFPVSEHFRPNRIGFLFCFLDHTSRHRWVTESIFIILSQKTISIVFHIFGFYF